jgi:hypothetical protein
MPLNARKTSRRKTRRVNRKHNRTIKIRRKLQNGRKRRKNTKGG